MNFISEVSRREDTHHPNSNLTKQILYRLGKLEIAYLPVYSVYMEFGPNTLIKTNDIKT